MKPPTLTTAAAPVPPYAHPASRITVAFHEDGQAFSATGIHAGEAITDKKPTNKK